MKRTNIIYKAENIERKCFYVGYSTNGLKSRKHHHKQDCFKRNKNTKFYNFVRKYGWNSFNWQILAVYSTKEELFQGEIDWLEKQKKDFYDWECLNVAEAGGRGNIGWVPSEEIRQKIGNANRGEKNYWFGKTGNLNPNFGKHRPHTEEEKNNLSNKKKKHYENLENRPFGEKNPMYGKSFYDVWIKKYGKEIANQKLESWKEKMEKVWDKKVK